MKTSTTISTFVSLLLLLSLQSSSALVVDEPADQQQEGRLRGTASRSLQSQNELDPEPDTWIVEFKPGTTGIANRAAQLAKNNGGQLGFVYEHAIKGFVFHGKNIQGISQNPNVLSVSRDSVSTIAAQTMPKGVMRVNAANKNYMKDASATCFCDAVVAVIDTGVDFSHPDLKVNTAKSVDCTLGTPCVVGGKDDHGHGTHVAGTIGAIDNDQGVVGVCPGAEIWAIKVLNSAGSGYRSWIIAGIDYVTSQGATVDVANMSLGGSGCDSTYCSAITKAKNAGVAFAVAAGNSNVLASGVSPACCADVLSKYYLISLDHLMINWMRPIMSNLQLLLFFVPICSRVSTGRLGRSCWQRWLDNLSRHR